MLYEARVGAVIRIEAAKGVSCRRKDAIKKYPSAEEYNSVKLLLLIPLTYLHV